MGETKVSKINKSIDRNQLPKLINPAILKLFTQAPQRMQHFFEVGTLLGFEMVQNYVSFVFLNVSFFLNLKLMFGVSFFSLLVYSFMLICMEMRTVS